MSIVKMKRLRLFGMLSDREELLQRLQHLGCVEISESADKLSDPEWAALLTRSGSDKLAEKKEAHTLVSSALATLNKYAPVKTGLFTSRRQVTEKQLFDEEARTAALAAATALNGEERQISSLYAEQSKLKTQILSLVPWLELDVPLETSSTRDVSVKFGTVSADAPLDTLTGELNAAAPLAELIPAGKDRELQYFLFLCHKSAEDGALEVLKKYGFSQAAIRGWTGTAAENTRKLEAELADLGKQLEEAKSKVASFGGQRDNLKLCVDRLEQEIRREEAKTRLLNTRSTFFLEGWVPGMDEGQLRELLKPYVCAWETEEPVRDDYPQVPIKLKNNKVVAPATMITSMYSLPAYDGIDPNPFVFPFFVLFFGIMFGDMGYGLALFLLTRLYIKKVRPKGGTGDLMRLMNACGLSAMVVGFFTGGFFSNAIATVCGLLGLQTPYLFTVTNPPISALTDPITCLIIAMGIGCVHILLGMSLNAYMLIRDGHPLDALFDVGSWWVVFAGVALGATGHGWAVALVGVAMLVLTQGRSSPSIPGKIIGGLGSLYNITGYFGDILSYSRLMVMMLAGGVIGNIFNMLGAMPGNIFIFAIIFVCGHIFNMALSVIGCYVHASRLIYLEFFGKFYREGGRPFKPLDIDTRYVDIIKEEN